MLDRVDEAGRQVRFPGQPLLRESALLPQGTDPFPENLRVGHEENWTVQRTFSSIHLRVYTLTHILRRMNKRGCNSRRDRDACIRSLFLKRRESYSTAEAARFTNLKRDELIRRIEEDGEIEPVRAEYWIAWQDVVRLALERWPLDVVYAALGDRADEALPSMLRLENFTARIPVYVIRLLEHAAAREKTTIQEYLRRELRELAEGENMKPGAADELEAKIPGFHEALFFPDRR